MDTLGHRLRAGRFNCRQSISQHRGQNGDHLPIAIAGTDEPTPHAF
jgi:hypothetical protein